MQNTQQLLKTCMVAYIDIMGTKEISKDPIRKNELLSVLLDVHHQEQKEGYFEVLENGGKAEANVTSFSDCIVISIPLCKNLQSGIEWDAALYIIQQHISRLFSRALAYNFLIRGAIDVGELYHVKHMVFGQSLVDAYINESKAIYPRIVLTDSCLAKRVDYSYEYPIPNQPNYIFELQILDFNNFETNFNFITQNSTKVFTDYDGTTCLRVVNTRSWYDIPDPLIDFKKSIEKGKVNCKPEFKKNWIWLGRYMEKETYTWQQFKKLVCANS